MPKKYIFKKETKLKIKKEVSPEEILKELKKLNESFIKLNLYVTAISEDVNDLKDAIESSK